MARLIDSLRRRWGARPTTGRHGTAAKVGVACVALAMTAAGCTAGNAGGGGSTGGGASTAQYLNYSPCCTWNSTWSYNPYNVNGLIYLQPDFVLLRLATQKYPSLTDYEPQLADKWSVDGNKMTVHIRDGAKWQDGTPVTSTDLYDTAILDGLNAQGFWNDITGVAKSGTDSVVFTLRDGQPTALAYNDILNNLITYPSSQYGTFVTSQLEKDVPDYFTQFQKDPDAAAKSAAFGRMNDAFKKLAAYKPPSMLGNGPFKLDNITTSQARLSKWDGFYAADKIKVPGLNFGNGSNQTIYPQLFAGKADFSNVYLPPPILERWNKTKGANLALPQAFGFVMSFNNHRYPLNMVKVRQALAYVIPRQTMSQAAYGTTAGAGGKYKEVNTGISPTLENLYLTQQQVGSLNTYPVDTDKATDLLKSAGFTQANGQWIMPNGKPFTLTFNANSDTSDIVTSFTSAAKSLTTFGIKSDVNATSGAQQGANQLNGNFDIGMNFVSGNNPLGMYQQMMGSANNYPSLGNYSGKRGMGVGPTADVPGLGNVNVSATLDKQARNVAPDQTMKNDTWDWAQFVNQQVPYIWYATKVYQYSYSDTNYTNWPPKDASGTSPLWDIVGGNTSAGLLLAMEQGYIVPKG